MIRSFCELPSSKHADFGLSIDPDLGVIYASHEKRASPPGLALSLLD
jgi:hypothetical protein